jgi:hypothetical protein
MTSRKTSCLLAAAILAVAALPLSAYADNNLTFKVVDAQTHQPVRDSVVTINGQILAPGGDGGYSVPASTQAIMARAPGYERVTVAANTVSGSHQIALKPFTVHALYMSEYGITSSVLRDPVLNIIHHGGANALVVNIKSDHGLLVYPSQIELAQKIGARKLTLIKSLPDLVNAGHAQGIYMIARIVTFKDDPLATARPDLAIHKPDGSLFADREHLHWADNTQPEARAYNVAIGVEAAKAGFDEVQYDYVRFPDFAQKLTFHGPTDEASRIKSIASFLDEARKALVPYNVFLSADIFGYTFWNTNDTGIGQHLEDLVNKVDYICPMLYPSGFQYGIPGHPKPMATTNDIYNIIKLSLDNGLKRTNANPKKFRPWLQAFRDYAFNKLVYGKEQVDIQIKAADEDHTDGWQLWNPGNHYNDIGLAGSKPSAPKPTETASAKATTTPIAPVSSNSASTTSASTTK